MRIHGGHLGPIPPFSLLLPPARSMMMMFSAHVVVEDPLAPMYVVKLVASVRRRTKSCRSTCVAVRTQGGDLILYITLVVRHDVSFVDVDTYPKTVGLLAAVRPSMRQT